VRDARINMIYEGTNTIQALDLLGRKILGDMGAKLKAFGKIVQDFVEEEGTNEAMQEFVNPLADIGDKVQKLTMEIGMKAMGNPDEVGAAAVPYLRVVGHLVFSYFWARMAKRRQVLHQQAGHGAVLLRQAAAGNRRGDPQGARRLGHADGAGRRPVLICRQARAAIRRRACPYLTSSQRSQTEERACPISSSRKSPCWVPA
jgi:hypothetical protein